MGGEIKGNRKRYSKEFKLEAVRMLEAGVARASRSKWTWESVAARRTSGARSWPPPGS